MSLNYSNSASHYNSNLKNPTPQIGDIVSLYGGKNLDKQKVIKINYDLTLITIKCIRGCRYYLAGVIKEGVLTKKYTFIKRPFNLSEQINMEP